MKISELIVRLQEVQAKEGDIPVEACVYSEMPGFEQDFDISVTDQPEEENPRILSIG